jgi:hypothetical protein
VFENNLCLRMYDGRTVVVMDNAITGYMELTPERLSLGVFDVHGRDLSHDRVVLGLLSLITNREM